MGGVVKYDDFFLFIMGLAWRCRYTIPALLTCTLAIIGQACVFEVSIRRRTIYNATLQPEDSEETTDSEQSAESWETIYEEVSH